LFIIHYSLIPLGSGVSTLPVDIFMPQSIAALPFIKTLIHSFTNSLFHYFTPSLFHSSTLSLIHIFLTISLKIEMPRRFAFLGMTYPYIGSY